VCTLGAGALKSVPVYQHTACITSHVDAMGAIFTGIPVSTSSVFLSQKTEVYNYQGKILTDNRLSGQWEGAK
jgi:hypothetical protein